MGIARRIWNPAVALAMSATLIAAAQAGADRNPYSGIDVSNQSLVSELEGFEEGFAEVNGIRLHYVAGGEGTPVVLLPGWPETWWAYHKVMPSIAEHYRVVAVDIRGMGATEKPEGGYDKKNMALDIRELVQSLGYRKAHIVGHDIGSQVAYAFAANYPDATLSMTLLDVPASDDQILEWKLLPKPGTALDRFDPKHPYLWWFAFNQVQGLPEQLLEGRAHILQDWFFENLMLNHDALTVRDRAIYADAYNSRDGIRGGNAWYQAFAQDVIDNRSYPERLRVPSFAIGGLGFHWLADFMERRTSHLRVEHIPESGHYIMEEAPEKVATYILEFLSEADSQ